MVLGGLPRKPIFGHDAWLRISRRGDFSRAMEYQKQTLLQATFSFLCAAIALRFVIELEGTEFGGGRITGTLLKTQNVGALFMLLAAFSAFLIRRIAAVIALLGCLLCLPLYLLLAAPGPFRWVARGEWSTPAVPSFVWDWWSIGAIVISALAASASIRSFAKANARS